MGGKQRPTRAPRAGRMPVLIAFLAAAVGAALFLALELPLPWLLGPLAGCLAAALIGLPMGGIGPLNGAMRTILGVAVGATLTPPVLASLPAMWPTLLLVPVMVAVCGLVGIPYFRRLCGYNAPTAYYAAMPGGLQDMLIFGEEAGGDPRTLSLVHATRILVIVVTLPFLLQSIWQADLRLPPGAPVRDVPFRDLALMGLAAALGWWAAIRVGLFGASILGPLLLAAAFAATGLLAYRPPAEAIWAAQFFIGMSVGSKYAGFAWNDMRRDLIAALGYCGILIAITVVFVEAVVLAGLATGREALLAFAPGGQAELTVLALIVGADAAFVVAHHLLRIFVVILGAPVLAARLGKERDARRR